MSQQQLSTEQRATLLAVAETALPAGKLIPGATSATVDKVERFVEKLPSQLSFGQQKLLEFATVLMGRPRLVLLDEPTAGVNPVMVESMERHIRDLHRSGITFLVVEHEMNLVMRLCDPVVVLDHGTKLAEGTPAEVQANPLVLDAYLGT